MEEDDILQWLLGHLEDDEIEDVDEDTLERMVKEGKTLAVLFCRFSKFTPKIQNPGIIFKIFFFQMGRGYFFLYNQ